MTIDGHCSTDVALARWSACSFSSFGICTNLAKNFWLTLSLTVLSYSFIFSPLTSQSLLICLTITYKLLCMTTSEATATLAKLRPVRTASY